MVSLATENNKTKGVFMKIKPLYIYGVIIIIIIAVLIVINNTEDDTNVQVSEEIQGTMPQDEIHKGLNNQTGSGPSKGNVKAEFWKNLEAMEKEVRANQKDTLKMRQYAEMLSMAHQTDKAIEQYDNILKIDANRIDVLLAEGLIYFNTGNYEKAEDATKRILAIDKDHLDAKYNLGAIAASKGETERAKEIWNDIVKNYPNSEQAKFAEEALARI